MKIRLSVAVSKDNSLLQHLYRDVDWSAIPRNGDSVEVLPDSTSSHVKTVHFEFDGSVLIILNHLFDMAEQELLEVGWQK